MKYNSNKISYFQRGKLVLFPEGQTKGGFTFCLSRHLWLTNGGGLKEQPRHNSVHAWRQRLLCVTSLVGYIPQPTNLISVNVMFVI